MGENPIPFEVPGKSRIFTKEEIASEYGERATRPIPPGYDPKKNVASRIFTAQTLKYRVYRLHSDGTAVFVSAHVTWNEADKKAGELRDRMTDEECAKGYTYEARERLTNAFSGGPKPWGVYAVYPDGRRVFISSHHSDTAAENKANKLNDKLDPSEGFIYAIGERKLSDK